MEIKECKSSDIIINEIKNVLIKILEKIHNNYKKELCIYHRWHSSFCVGEKNTNKIKVFGKVIYEDIEFKDILQILFSNRELEITIIDPFLYPIIKEEFTKFSETNKDSIKSMCLIKNF